MNTTRERMMFVRVCVCVCVEVRPRAKNNSDCICKSICVTHLGCVCPSHITAFCIFFQ